MAKYKSQPVSIQNDVPVRIPIPGWILAIADDIERRDALKECWLSYGFGDRYVVERLENGHYIMVRKG